MYNYSLTLRQRTLRLLVLRKRRVVIGHHIDVTANTNMKDKQRNALWQTEQLSRTDGLLCIESKQQGSLIAKYPWSLVAAKVPLSIWSLVHQVRNLRPG
jgi:hypothetical protein